MRHKKRDLPDSAIYLLAGLLVLCLIVEASIILQQPRSLTTVTGRQASGILSLTIETELPTITLTKSDTPDPISTNNDTLLNYTIIVNSTGSSTAYNVTVNETYPAGVTFVSASPTPTANVTFDLGNLSSGSAYVINITVNVSTSIANATVINNTVNVTFFSLINTIQSSVATANTTINNGSVAEEGAGPGGGPGGGGGGGGGGGCSDLCVLNTTLCGIDGRLRCITTYDADSCTEYAPAPCETGKTCSHGACVVSCVESWLCDDWSPCEADVQTRSCVDLNGCGTTLYIPDDIRACVPSVEELPAGIITQLLIDGQLILIATPIGPITPLLLYLPLIFLVGLFLAALLILVWLLFLFDLQFNMMLLFIRIKQQKAFLATKQYGLAQQYDKRVLGPDISTTEFNPKIRFHRKILRMYYQTCKELALAEMRIARQLGDAEHARMHERSAEKFSKLIEEYR